jgi:hypothetical protein
MNTCILDFILIHYYLLTQAQFRPKHGNFQHGEEDNFDYHKNAICILFYFQGCFCFAYTYKGKGVEGNQWI